MRCYWTYFKSEMLLGWGLASVLDEGRKAGGGVVRLKLDVQGQGSGRILDLDGRGGMGGLENCTDFMDVICVSSLKLIFNKTMQRETLSFHNYSSVLLR